VVSKKLKNLLRVFLASSVMCLFCPTYAGPSSARWQERSNGDTNENSNGWGNGGRLGNDPEEYAGTSSDFLEDEIENSAAADGWESGDYSEYASKLAKTLSLISAADQAWIFGD
jgi:hypothetical protein